MPVRTVYRDPVVSARPPFADAMLRFLVLASLPMLAVGQEEATEYFWVPMEWRSECATECGQPEHTRERGVACGAHRQPLDATHPRPMISYVGPGGDWTFVPAAQQLCPAQKPASTEVCPATPPCDIDQSTDSGVVTTSPERYPVPDEMDRVRRIVTDNHLEHARLWAMDTEWPEPCPTVCGQPASIQQREGSPMCVLVMDKLLLGLQWPIVSLHDEDCTADHNPPALPAALQSPRRALERVCPATPACAHSHRLLRRDDVLL